MPSRVRRRALALVFVALLGLVLAHVALAGDPAGLSPRGPDSPQAAKIEDIYWVLIAITGAIFVLVEGALSSSSSASATAAVRAPWRDRRSMARHGSS